MQFKKSGSMTRRSLLKTSAGTGAALMAGTGGVSMFNVRSAYSQDLPNPADVLAKINVAGYVNKDYQKQYGLKGDELMWDPKKDWIRTADWEAIRKEHAGKTVRFLISSDDRESALQGTQPFHDLSGINIDHVVRATWIIGGGLACAAGSLLSMDVFLKPDLSFNLLLPIFAATIVGGIGQPYGAIAGGFLVGFSETLAIFNWSVLLRPLAPWLPFDLPASIALVPTEYKLTVPFVILIIVLVYRPTGIFKGRVL